MAEPWFFEVLPCRPAPYPDECLSGYLLRLADANGVAQFWDLASELFPRWSYSHQVTRLRWEYPVEDWCRLVQRLHITVSALRALTVAPLVAKFRPPLEQARSHTWSPGMELHGVVKPDLQVCPLCLQAAPYVRLVWRLASVAACLEHGCRLQTHCQACGTLLSAASPAQRHLRCANCGADLRSLPVVPAPALVLAAQARHTTGLRFLLDPEPRLVPALPSGSPELPGAVGLKFRYLRVQEKRSVAAMARQMRVDGGTLSALELGQPAPLALYLAYLDQFELNWPEFAGLHIPPEFVEELHTPPHLALRRCPTEGCPNHGPQPTPQVILLADLPKQRIARFGCRACGHTFTRSYDGHLTARPRQPVLQPGDPPTIPKPPREVARLKAMGLRGETNRRIARALGWGAKTVHMYWIALNLEDQVHQAQARRRARERRDAQAALRAQVEAVLQAMGQEEQVITVSRVAVRLGQGPDYLNNHRDLAQRVMTVAGSHNARLKQQRYATVQAVLEQAIAQMQQSDTLVTVAALVQPTGLSYDRLRLDYPELFRLVQQAARSHRARWRDARRQARQAAINAAAARLVARGTRLTYGIILKEAGLSTHTPKSDPVLRDLLQQWVGGFAAHD